MKTSVKVVETASEVIVSVLSAALGHRPGKQTPCCCFSGGNLIWEINDMDQRGAEGTKLCHRTNQHFKCGDKISTVKPGRSGGRHLVQSLMRFRECVSVVADPVGTWALLTTRGRAVT